VRRRLAAIPATITRVMIMPVMQEVSVIILPRLRPRETTVTGENISHCERLSLPLSTTPFPDLESIQETIQLQEITHQ